jgi:GTP-binding protein
MTKISHPKIVIVGRPNVGKSSLFNRIVGERKAIVESASGTTRDRLYADIKWKAKAFTIVDTGGFEPARPGDMAALVFRQLNAAIDEADIIFFMTDSAAGVVAQEIEFSERLRKTSKKIFLIANKSDDTAKAYMAAEFYSLGLGEPYAVSAMNGNGIDRLLDDAVKLVERPAEAVSSPSVRVAIVGRPNVGKSSYLNSVLNEERVIVHPIAGTTRDSIDTDFEYKDKGYLLIDTAGIRHNAKLREAADFYGSVRSKEAIQRCDVAIVMIDGFDGLREDDRRIVEFVIEAGKGLVVAVNKWDLTANVEMSKYTEMLIKKMSRLKNYPVIFISCKTKRNTVSCLDAVWSVYCRAKTAIPSDALKKLLKSLNELPEVRSKRIKFLRLDQEASQPPTFALIAKHASAANENLKKYIENFFRAHHDLVGVPVKIRYIDKTD